VLSAFQLMGDQHELRTFGARKNPEGVAKRIFILAGNGIKHLLAAVTAEQPVPSDASPFQGGVAFGGLLNFLGRH